MKNDARRQTLLEASTSAWRPSDPSGTVQFHPAWYDLDKEGRLKAFEIARTMRQIEAAVDPKGLSSTGRMVLRRILKASP